MIIKATSKKKKRKKRKSEEDMNAYQLKRFYPIQDLLITSN
ncbi:MAG: hypothetical protein ACI8RD_013933 [Bacillariaceae sp.]|jgi:hypothetical protein